jgi:predicted dehydrogenase
VKPLRLGIIGTGVAARILHWPALRQLAGYYEITAVANRSRDKGEAFARLVGLGPTAVYTDYRELLARGDLDVVDLLLPPQFNYEVARAAAGSGISIICEKPIAPTLELARSMVALPQMYGVQLLVAENFRYDNAVQKARELIDQGVIGPPFMISYQWMQPVPPDDEIAGRPWRRQPHHEGGYLSDHGVHMIDVMRYLMGEVAAVHAFALDLREHLGGSDTAVIGLQFDSEAIGSIHWSFGVVTEQFTQLQLWGDDGTLTVDPGRIRMQRKGRTDEILAVDGPSSFVNEFKDFYNVLVDGTEPTMTAWDALQDLRVVLAASRSSAAGEVVFLDGEPRR